MSGQKLHKLAQLANMEGFSTVEEMLENDSIDSVASGICTNPGCDYCDSVDPDCSNGYCPECDSNTVQSSLNLAGVI